MEITVTSLSLYDRAEWEKLYYVYAEFYSMAMSQEVLDTIWSWIFDTNIKFYCLIAKNELGLGLGLMHYREMPSPLRGATTGFLEDLFVSPEYKDKGIVNALYNSLSEEAKSCGFNRWPQHYSIKKSCCDEKQKTKLLFGGTTLAHVGPLSTR